MRKGFLDGDMLKKGFYEDFSGHELMENNKKTGRKQGLNKQIQETLKEWILMVLAHG